MILLLENTIQNYAWGSHEFIAALCGRTVPAAAPEAEMWMGAHASAPSFVRRGSERLSLGSLLAQDPERLLGPRVHQQFGQLPFLLKVLAAAQPLSLQAHPSLERARAGYLEEERRGVPLSDPTRNYKDDNHKPELVVALTPFVALCGFRELSATRRLLETLGVAELALVAAPFSSAETSPSAPAQATLRDTFERWIHTPRNAIRGLVEALHEAASKALQHTSEFALELQWAERLTRAYPDDAGSLCALLLNVVELSPGQGLYLAAGNLHAYLNGAAIEIMASSDNVLRGGLTPKHVDVAELLRVLDFSESAQQPLEAEIGAPSERCYVTPAREFRLSTLDVREPTRPAPSDGPEILLVTRGSVDLQTADERLSLACGGSAFLPAQTTFTLSGNGFVYRASVPARCR